MLLIKPSRDRAAISLQGEASQLRAKTTKAGEPLLMTLDRCLKF
jgi:hypothetical protein